ncbi:MAG: peptidase [Lachnospiraceae bacterium]|nr:peptidase [Lachnospiraceae bacterium]
MEFLKNLFEKFAENRLLPISLILCLLLFSLVRQLYGLQILDSASDTSTATYTNEKKIDVPSTRGNIYDRNGVLLATDELTYSVTIIDTGELETNEEKNEMIKHLVEILDAHKVKYNLPLFIKVTKNGEYKFTVEDNVLTRFKKDVYGIKSGEELNAEQENATAKDVFDYLNTDQSNLSPKFGVPETYEPDMAVKVLAIRYALYLKRYQKYMAATVATDLNEEAVAAINENSADLPGVKVEGVTHRVYHDSEYFAHIVGYTGQITSDEYSEFSENGQSQFYTYDDQIGRSGIEKEYESYLHGIKGTKTVSVDADYRITGEVDSKKSIAGSDVYLTIDSELQKACYKILEQRIAGILLSKITNSHDEGTKGTSAAGIMIPIYDVYAALINNNVIDTSLFKEKKASDLEKSIYSKYQSEKDAAFSKIKHGLDADIKSDTYLDEETKSYLSYIYSMLKEKDIILTKNINIEDETYVAFGNDEVSLSEFLQYALSKQWIDTTKLDNLDQQFYSTEELYEQLVDYILRELKDSSEFDKSVYNYMIQSEKISGKDVCLLLYEQGVLKDEDGTQSKLRSGTLSSYEFMRNMIRTLKITPDMLALKPCSGSIVVTDAKKGEVLALVTYPSYDNNKLANSIDSDYYSKLQSDSSYPMLNRPLQQKTAPGSTYKMVTAAAALDTEAISINQKIQDKLVFDKIPLNPKCWSSTSHGNIDIVDALQVSCNYFFYEVGYNMSLDSKDNYESTIGLKKLRKYATMFGFNTNSGIELHEADPNISDEDSVRSAIGQGTNSFTPSQIARYVTTLANKGDCFDLTIISKVMDSNGNLELQNEAKLHNKVDLDYSIWATIKQGMYKVVNGPNSSISKLFEKLKQKVAGKTGTAQESKKDPNHALFVSYAPYEDPEIAVTVVIPNGYTSSNAAEVARNVYKYYFAKDKSKINLDGDVTLPELDTTISD